MALFGRLNKLFQNCSIVRFASISPVLNSVEPSERKPINIWEPDYLKEAKSDIPEYQPINVQMKGYDFQILENFQGKVYRLGKEIGLESDDGWAQESKKMRVVRLKPRSAITDVEFIVHLYERNIRFVNMNTIQASLLIELVMSVCPAGVSVSIHAHTPEIEENRFVPDYDTQDLQIRLADIMAKKP